MGARGELIRITALSPLGPLGGEGGAERRMRGLPARLALSNIPWDRTLGPTDLGLIRSFAGFSAQEVEIASFVCL